MSTASELYLEGNLTEALKNILEEVRDNPSSVSKRAFLIELLCFNGDWERADKQLNTLLSLDEKSALTVGTWRQLIRAAQTREDVFRHSAIPDLIEKPTDRIQKAMKLLLVQNEKDAKQSKVLVSDLEASPQRQFSINEETASQWRDLDDLNSGVLELLGTNGKYFWVDFDQIENIEFEKAVRPLDLLWRKAAIVLKSGTAGEVFIPTIYPVKENDDDLIKLGRKTDWVEHYGAIRGEGLRTMLVGDTAISVMDIDSVEFTSVLEEAIA